MRFVRLNDDLVNLDNVELIDVREVGDKISVSVFFVSGESRHFVLDKRKDEFVESVLKRGEV